MSSPVSLDTWWYWQAFRTWVPYTSKQVAAIQQAQGQNLAEVNLPDSPYKLVFNFQNEGPHQVKRDNFYQHRNARSLPVPHLFRRENILSQTALAISYHELVQLDRTSGHAPRLTIQERAARAVDKSHQLDSMRRTLQEQLGGAEYHLVLDSSHPEWGGLPSTLIASLSAASSSSPAVEQQLEEQVEQQAGSAAMPANVVAFASTPDLGATGSLSL